MRESPSAKLVSFTPDPIGLIFRLWWQDKFGYIPDYSPTKQFRFVMQLLREDWCPLLEFPVFCWQMVLPRSLHAQVRVHRHWSCFSESDQLRDRSRFALEKDFFEIPGLTVGQRAMEYSAMLEAQNHYEAMRRDGLLPSLARGVLPQHINLGLSVATNLRSLFKVVVERRCHILQGTYWNPLLDAMKSEMICKVNPDFAEMFELQPCDITGRCLSDIEQELRKEKADPHIVCPRWKQMQRTQGKETCCGNACQGCLCFAREEGLKVEREIHDSAHQQP